LLERHKKNGAPVLIVASFLAPRTREILANQGASFIDATGNLRLTSNEPAVYIECQGLDSDPNRRPRPLRSLKGAAASRVVRALCDFRPPYGVRELAQVSSTPLGTVSRVVSFAEEQALLSRNKHKQITSVDWVSLIRHWGRDYNVRNSNVLGAFLEPRGLPALLDRLGKLDRYAVTGSLAAVGEAPARLAMIYVDDINTAANLLNLVPTEAGANVWLLEPFDAVVFERTRYIEFGEGHAATSVVAAAQSQVTADLLTSPGRGPQEAEALITWMKGTEDAWRQYP